MTDAKDFTGQGSVPGFMMSGASAIQMAVHVHRSDEANGYGGDWCALHAAGALIRHAVVYPCSTHLYTFAKIKTVLLCIARQRPHTSSISLSMMTRSFTWRHDSSAHVFILSFEFACSSQRMYIGVGIQQLKQLHLHTCTISRNCRKFTNFTPVRQKTTYIFKHCSESLHLSQLWSKSDSQCNDFGGMALSDTTQCGLLRRGLPLFGCCVTYSNMLMHHFNF